LPKGDSSHAIIAARKPRIPKSNGGHASSSNVITAISSSLVDNLEYNIQPDSAYEIRVTMENEEKFNGVVETQFYLYSVSRYFNVCGNHPMPIIDEDFKDQPNINERFFYCTHQIPFNWPSVDKDSLTSDFIDLKQYI